MFQPDLFKGKRILVTGGGTGLGRAMAEEFLELGADIYICGRRESACDETARELMDRHGGNFYELRNWTDEQWAAAKEAIQRQNEQDRKQR